MAPPTLPTYSSRSNNVEFDPATQSDEEEDFDNRSISSRSTWASTSSATILGFSDGYVGRGGAELSDWRVSRIGGAPSFPPMFSSPLLASSSTCLACSSLMPLLTQIYCPLDSSTFERILYVFGCPKRSCRSKEGTVRCWRASVPWVEVEEEEELEEVKVTKKEESQLGNLIFGEVGLFGSTPPPSLPATGAAVNFNPFAPTPVSTTTTSSNPFILTTSVSDITSSLESTTLNNNPFINSSESISNKNSTSNSNSKTPRIKPVEPPSPINWISHPSFPPQYLTTAYEPSAPTTSIKIPQSVVVLPTTNEEAKHRDGKGAGGRVKKGASSGGTSTGGDDWSREGYEVQKVKGVDEVFLGFQERVAREGKQCIRYDHSSTPLPFSSTSKPYLKLFPSSSTSTDDQPIYTPSILSPCSYCQQSKTFELQLMPQLVSLLNKSMALPNSTALVTSVEGGDEVKGKEKKNVMEEDGLEWASVWIFTCLSECLKEGDVDGWREEQCMIEWEEQ